MKVTYLHWVAYPALLLIIVWLFAASLEPAIHLDHMQQAQLQDQRSFADHLRYISVNSNCDTTPQQLASAMGKGYDLIDSGKGSREVAHLAFFAKYEGDRLVGVEVSDRGSVAVCSDKRPGQ